MTDDTPVPLRQRPIPEQLDYLGDKLAAQIDTQTVPHDALIAMGAAVVNMGHIAVVLRKQAKPLTGEEFADLRAFCNTWLAELAQHGWLSRHLLLADGSELDVSRLSAALDELERLRRGLRLVLDQHYPIPCSNVRHDGGRGQHCAVCEYDDIETGWWPCPTARGAMAALGDAKQQPEDGDRG